MKAPGKSITIIVTAIALPTMTQAAGNKLDTSDPFVCVPTAVSECGISGDCIRGTAQSENLPQVFKIDLNAKTIRSDQGRQSSIEKVTRSRGKVILSGGEAERAWTVLIREDTGDMTGAVTGDGVSFALFGICLAP